MAIIGKVLRMRHREKKSVREIVKATSLARNTVRKYLRIGKAEAPRYRRAAVPTKLAPFVQAVQQALLADTRRPKKERRTAKALHAQLAGAGYEGGYSRLTDYIRQWRAERGGVQVGDAYVPLSFELGEAFQFDWSEEPLVIGGQYQRLQVAQRQAQRTGVQFEVRRGRHGSPVLWKAFQAPLSVRVPVFSECTKFSSLLTRSARTAARAPLISSPMSEEMAR